MAECFCGCGRKIRFRGRVPNEYGKTAKLFNEKLAADRSLDRDDPDVQTLLTAGERWFDRYAAAVHGEIRMNSLDRDEWLRWRNAAFQLIKIDDKKKAMLWEQLAAGLSPDTLLAGMVNEPDFHLDVDDENAIRAMARELGKDVLIEPLTDGRWRASLVELESTATLRAAEHDERPEAVRLLFTQGEA